jgi:hypothetical protein
MVSREGFSDVKMRKIGVIFPKTVLVFFETVLVGITEKANGNRNEPGLARSFRHPP